MGVDKRCVRNALFLKTMLEYRKIADLKEIEKIGVKMITPDEYLEKIFQIPFELKSAEQKILWQMVDHLLKNQVQKRKSQAEGIDQSPIYEEEGEREQHLKEEKTPDAPEKKKESLGPEADFQRVVAPGLSENLTSIDQHFDKMMQGGMPSGKDEATKQESDASKKQLLVSSAPKDLSLSEAEFTCLKGILVIVGDTPRTVKRYLNIYRIIRSHAILTYNETSREDVFLFVMFLLALGIGKHGEKAKNLFTWLQLNSGENVLAGLKETGSMGEEVINSISDVEEISRLLEFRASMLDESIIPFVSRFSFSSDISDLPLEEKELVAMK